MPAWWLLTRSEQVRSRPFRHGYLVGLIYFGGVFWWISNVTAIGTFFLVLYLALYPALWFLLVARLIVVKPAVTSAGTLGQAFAAAAVWVMLEWWRSWFLTGFNWNELGISQAPSIIFRQMAAFGGVHLLSFILVTVNVLWAEGVLRIAETAREKRVVRPSLPFAAALLVVAICFALGWHHLERHRGETALPKLTFACIQPDIPQIADTAESYADYRRKEKEALEKTESLSSDALTQPVTKPDLLIWPEAFTGEEVFERTQLNEIVREIASSFDGYFLLGSQESDVQHVYNSAYLFGPGWDTYQVYRKTHLVILGEYIPFGTTFPWLHRVIGIGMDMTPGPGPKVFELQHPAMKFAPFICFEDTLPEVANKAAALGPDFFVTITNDGWYQGWCAAWGIRQHLNHAIFRCIEHDRPMIRCANTGISCVIDENGTVTSRFTNAAGQETDIGGIFAGTLQPYPARATLYEKGGDWIVLISSLVSVMLGIRLFSRSRP